MRLLTNSLIFSLASAASLEISIPASNVLPNPNTLAPSSTRAYLSSSGDPLLAHLTRQNTFFFPSIPVGSHLLTVISRDNFFENLRVDVIRDEATGAESVEAWTTYRGNEWSNKGELRTIGDTGARGKVEVRCVGAKDYYMKRASFSIMSIFSNPMILVGIFTLAMVVGMPWLMENMDPEVKAEFEEMQKSQTGMTSQASNLHNMDLAGDFASWMSGGSKKDDTTVAASSGRSKK